MQKFKLYEKNTKNPKNPLAGFSGLWCWLRHQRGAEILTRWTMNFSSWLMGEKFPKNIRGSCPCHSNFQTRTVDSTKYKSWKMKNGPNSYIFYVPDFVLYQWLTKMSNFCFLTKPLAAILCFCEKIIFGLQMALAQQPKGCQKWATFVFWPNHFEAKPNLWRNIVFSKN